MHIQRQASEGSLKATRVKRHPRVWADAAGASPLCPRKRCVSPAPPQTFSSSTPLSPSTVAACSDESLKKHFVCRSSRSRTSHHHHCSVDMANFPSPVWVRRYVLNFNAVALVLLAVQNAGYLVLISYSQQQGKEYPLAAGGAEPEEEEVRTVTFKASHFLATTELVKLFLSLLWCVVDEAWAMQQERCSADTLTTPTAALLAEGSGRSNVAAFAQTPNSVADASCHLSRNLDDVADDMDAESLDHTVRLRVLFARKRFAAVFLSRMRHAIGLDHKYKETLLMIVPAIVYAIQGLLLIYSLKLLDPTVFQVLYQVRILFLAVMMRVVLDFRLSPIRWGALVALMFGITLAQMGAQSTRADMTTSKADDAARSEMENAAATEKTSSTWSMEGTLAALAGGFLSAFSGVFMEFVVKKRGNQFHLSARNTHLAFFSVVYFFIVFLCEIFQPEEGAGGLDEFTSTFFDGFTRLVWFLVVLQAIGGILVALVVRYCDNIVKSFSTAFAIVLSGTASVFLFHTPLNGTFLLGSFLVLTSITMYTAKK
ncbi:putative CMP-sialic acid transporter [Leishmania infantum JPCM5]|uniref:Putative CMP-sialic acid transporter n=1 Tax=Leishmania infantum TaxID=5671 RepID=E9AH47_LEIIN|nr:putative CMP-sialic acid transporter [Leishmania infantum JPCM5]CBZ08716.1 putative CMP-sialic acid transporter [Leishmania infantum JPCM5]|eukprot:XP_003392548.1 putative CMP-sialic acid transporter [Leishmania infantum JPCM5]